MKNMIELNEKARNYVEDNALNLLKDAFAKAYTEGYRAGYHDRESEALVDMSDKTEFVDLGLPSGTLWASDYEHEGGELLYLLYEKAQSYNLPSKEQWTELLENCKWEYSITHGVLIEARCVGKNGNILKFGKTGMFIAEKLVKKSGGKAIFWLVNDEYGNDYNAVHMYYDYVPYNSHEVLTVKSVFSGYSLPIRQVSTK